MLYWAKYMCHAGCACRYCEIVCIHIMCLTSVITSVEGVRLYYDRVQNSYKGLILCCDICVLKV